MAISTTRKMLVTLSTIFAALIAGAFFRGNIKGEGPGIPSVSLNISPLSPNTDPGPSTLVGGATEPNGTQFVWADYMIEGPGSYRVYFDRHDNLNFHFLDRRGENVSIGLCEAGLEQIFATATLGAAAPLRLARHRSHIGLFQDGKLVISAFDDRLVRGSTGFRMLSKEPAISLKAEPRDDFRFADDFMIADNKAAQWRGNGDAKRGDFMVKSLKNPSMSANAFSYFGAGNNIHSVVGEPWWDYYRFEASMRGPVDGKIGLVFAYQDDKNYGLFRWSARKTDAAAADTGKRELVRVRNGQEEVLMQSPGGYTPDQWYTGLVRVTYSHVTISIDGHALAGSNDPYLAAGGAGVWCDFPLPAAPAADPKAQAFSVNSLNDLMKQYAVFDDVIIGSLDGFEDEFRTTGALAGGWLSGSGDWQCGAGELRVVPTSGAAKALIGDRRWTQYELECDVQPGSGAAGIVFLHRDEGNYYYATVDSNSALVLTRVADGRPEIVDSAVLPKTDKPNAKIRLKATVKHGYVNVLADQGTSVETFDPSAALTGRAGLLVNTGPGRMNNPSQFSRFRLSFLPEPEPLVTTNAIFEEEFTESWHEWTSPSSEWYPPLEPAVVEGRPVNLLWHRSQFPGDVELILEPREITEAKFELALSVGKDGQGRNNGYVFRYKTGDAPAGGSHMTSLQLFRQGEKVQEKLLPEEVRQLSSMSLRRCGKYIVGTVNGVPALSFCDKNPLMGSRVAFYTRGVTVRTEAAKIISDNFRNDLFSSAPVTWRTAGAAIAEVTNRWQCDPRWSFFSLKNDRKAGKPAVMWSKNLYSGDCTVEFYVGNKMEGERGTPYSYARDINVTICSDGTDLNKGYTFMFGGQGNAGSMIYRDGVEVKRSPARIPMDMNYHRHWYAVKIEKSGGTVTFRVDRFFGNTPHNELVYEDTKPLSGDHLAIWTYDHAIMLSRVRISGEGGTIMENPDWQPGPLKTPYDGK